MQNLITAVFTILMALTPSRHDTETRDERAGRMWITAHAIATVSQNDRDAAKLITQGFAESKFDAAVGANECRPGTCDWNATHGFRARGFWQAHENKRNTHEWHAITSWSPESVLAAAKAARWSLSRCKNAAHAFQSQDGDGCRQGAMGDARYKRMLEAENAIRVVRAGGEVPAAVRGWQ